MRKLINKIYQWQEDGKDVALATVIKTWGSAPRKIGAHMVVTEDNIIAGSVSGGCVEGAVISESLEVLKTGMSKRLKFGVSDDDAWEVGLACGGEIEIFIHKLTSTSIDLLNTMLDDDFIGSSETILREDEFTDQIFSITNNLISFPNISDRTNSSIFINHYPSPRHLIIIGGAEIGVELTKLSSFNQIKTSLIDPRKIFTNKHRFGKQVEVYSDWPSNVLGTKINLDSFSAVVSLSHDPKIDDIGLIHALKSDAFYIGALGSKKTHAKRIFRLTEKGFSNIDLERIHGPIGIDINAITPAEIAIAIISEIILHKNK